ncbi:hypothetical protein [Calothrix rhizosoleniae]|uniref:hypothetical protein n=1 Tax=Calothrix rhizosoleniae TaxID=888997 RepID=UPI000B49FAB7|nr:hypothetical protein [Calothrix rhizosoleniae]
MVTMAGAASLILSPATVRSETIENVKVKTKTNPVKSTSQPIRSLKGQQTKKQEKTPLSPIAPTTTTDQGKVVKFTGIKILSPTPEDVLSDRTTTIILQFPENQETELRVNGKLVEKSLIGRTAKDAQTKSVTQTWYGVPLQPRENIITAQLVGSTKSPATVKVMVSGAATQMKVETVESRIPADGRSIATVKGKLLDENGNVSNWKAIVTLTATDGEFVGADFKPDIPGFQVEAQEGKFAATFKSGLKAKTVTIQAKTIGLEAFTQLQLETALRPSLVTGVVDVRLGARGTNFFSSLRDFLPTDGDNSTQLDFRSAIFATGAIGEWLFTGAYDSSRTLNQGESNNRRQSRELQFDEKTYPVYGDSSKVEAVASSLDSLYVRLERSPKISGAEPDYVMWGNYNTNELSRSSQQFTATNRKLHGFKGNYNLGNLQITGFYSQNVEGFQRDNISPDGTSGYYFLSQRLVVPGSESIYIELEELNRPGTVLQRTKLSRGADYDIDYDRGSILFQEPILRTDLDENGQVLVRKIVATYEYESTQSSDSNIFGGRLQYNFARGLKNESWLGTSYIREDKGTRDFELYGADTQISLGSGRTIIAEYAHSTNNSVGGTVNGEAWRVEAKGEIFKGLQARAHYRTASPGFANNATVSFVPGQTRYGAQLTGKLSKKTNLRLQYDHEDNFGVAPQVTTNLEDLLNPETTTTPGSPVDNSLTTISAGIQQHIDQATVNLDLLHRFRRDKIANTETKSEQLRSRLTFPIAKKLTFSAQNELSISSNSDTVYSDRTLFGLNWTLRPGVKLSLTQQFYHKGQYSGNSFTSLNINGEHKLARDTTVTGRYSITGGANGMTGQGAVGLKHKWHISPGLRLDLAYERAVGNFFGKNGTGKQFAQPFAVGQSSSALGYDSGDSYSVGLEYTDNPDFKASARYQHRKSSNGSNTVISANATGKISPALTGLFRYEQASSANQKLEGIGSTANLKLGLAYRNPQDDKFNALLRYEYRKNPSTVPESALFDSGTGAEDHTFGLEAIYAPNWRWEFYGKYAFRNSKSYLAEDLVGTSATNLGQFRATYRLNKNMDVVGEARWTNQDSFTETGFLLEAGYYLSPNLRLAAGYAFGKVNDRDFSGSRSAGGPYLGLTLKLNELFSGFGLQKVTPVQQQESKVKSWRRRTIW